MFVGTGTSSSSVTALLSWLAATRPGPVRSPGSDGAQAGSGVRRSLLSPRSVVLRLEIGSAHKTDILTTVLISLSALYLLLVFFY